MGMYPKSMTKEDVANLTQEEKDMYLYKWIMAKPTPHNIMVVSMILPTLPSEFWDFLMEGILYNFEMDKVEPTEELIKEDIEAAVECWMSDIDSFFEYIELFIEARQPKTLVKVNILS